MKHQVMRMGWNAFAALALLGWSACSTETETVPSEREVVTFLTFSASPPTVRPAGEHNDTATITITVEEGSLQERDPVEGTVVYFSLPNGGGSLSDSEAETDEEGKAQVVFTPGAQEGTVQIKATLLPPLEEDEEPEEETAQNTLIGTVRIVEGSGAPADIVDLQADPATINVGGTSTLTLTVVDAEGDVVSNPTEVDFTLGTVDAGTLSTNPRTTAGGVATTTFTAGESAGVVTITATVRGTEITEDINVEIVPPAAGSILCVGAEPNVLGIKGSGFNEVSTVAFQVFFSDGSAADGTDVSFSIIAPTGGAFLEPTSASAVGGTAVTQLHSGTTPGPLSVRATVQGETLGGQPLTTVCSNITIAGGVPNGKHIGLVAETPVLEGLICVPSVGGEGSTDVTATVADIFDVRIPVEAQRTVSFFSEAGAVGRVATIADGRATVNLTPQAPAPTDTAPGFSGFPENFLDLNGNGTRQEDEPFDDFDMSGTFSTDACTEPCSEVFSRAIPAGTPAGYVLPNWHTNPGDGYVNYLSVIEGQEGFVDSFVNGLFDFDDVNSNGVMDLGEESEPFDDLGEPWIDANGDGIYNGVRHDPRTNQCRDETGRNYSDCDPKDYTESYHDANDNGHYDVGIDPFEDRIPNGVRDVSEQFIDNNNLSNNLPNVYDLGNGVWDATTFIYSYGPQLVPGSNLEPIGPGNSALFTGSPVNSFIERLRTICVVEGAIIEQGVDGDCAGEETLDQWTTEGGFFIPSGGAVQFRAWVADLNWNPTRLDTTSAIESDGPVELFGDDSQEMGGSRLRYFFAFAGLDDNICDDEVGGVSIEHKVKEDTACVEILAGGVMFGAAGGPPPYLRSALCPPEVPAP